MEEIEAIRTRYRPERIKTLFVGESAPYGGAFFYSGKTAMSSHMQSAVELALGKGGNFLKRFKAYGWYLDDLVLTPVNQLAGPQRRAECQAAVASLARRLSDYKPEAIVSVLYLISPFVVKAAKEAGSKVPMYALPFPGMSHQMRFRSEMALLIPKLPRLIELS